MKEARLCFFSNHSYNFVDDGTCDLSDVFKELQRVPVCWEKLSMKYNFHGPDQRS